MTLAESAHSEMDYRTVAGQFGNDHDVSIPAQLRFVDTPEQDIGRFHEALEYRGYAPVDSDPGHHHAGKTPHYDGEVMNRENYHRMKVLVFRGDLVRLFPHGEYLPTTDQLQALILAIEAGFSADLDHDPIDRGVSGGGE